MYYDEGYYITTRFTLTNASLLLYFIHRDLISFSQWRFLTEKAWAERFQFLCVAQYMLLYTLV